MISILRQSRRPDITVYANGRIDISASVAKSLALQKDDVVDILSDGHEDYLYIKLRAADTVGKHEAVCRPTKPRSNNFRTYSSTLANYLLQRVGVEERANLIVGKPKDTPEGILVPIITRFSLSR